MKNELQAFDVKSVPLKGRNLVEASAGTGKTYSIGMLVLRMIIEKKIPIENQLVVTFTKFAVAELQERIRLFVKEAYNAALGRPCKDATIQTIVSDVEDKTALKDRLRAALLMLDEAPIMTIHGFSQQMLNEFSFETGQAFQLELQSNVDDFIERVINKFWRKEVSLLPENVFEISDFEKIRKYLKTVFQKALGGQTFIGNAEIEDNLNAIEYANTVLQLKEEKIKFQEEISNYHTANKATIIEEIHIAKTHAIKALAPLIDDEEAMFSKVYISKTEKNTPKYYDKLQGEYWDKIDEYIALESDIKAKQALLIDVLLLIAQGNYLSVLQDSIEQSNVLTFDAMILNLHQVLVKENNEKLKSLIQAKYKVAFIDEFQDTDIIQFQLFAKLFIDTQKDSESILFLIGDPKQSIYAFRGADVDSYLAASKTVDQVYSMNTNFRSSESMVQATNNLYEAAGNAAFSYNDIETIAYHQVAAQHKERKFLKHGLPIEDTLVFAPHNNADNGLQGLADTIAALLNPENEYTLQANVDSIPRAIKPEDIAILVRKGDEGATAKKLLQKYNIPSVTVNDAKVLASQEAEELVLLLQAMIQPTINNVKSALYLSFLNTLKLDIDNQLINLSRIDDVQLLALFETYHELVLENRVYQAFMKLVSDFSVEQYFAQNVGQQRVLSNIFQIVELLHQQQYKKSLNAEELLVWLKQSIKAETEGDEYIMQIESDENAVNILTLHKSKGLEYPIVFIWGIHSEIKIQGERFYKLKSEGEQQVFKLGIDISTEEEYDIRKTESEELKRLIYVGITRAAYRCYIFYSTHDLDKKVLSDFTKIIPEHSGIIANYVLEEQATNYQSEHLQKPNSINIDTALLEESKSNWSILSYSALSVPHEYEPKLFSKELKSYNHFIFNELERGANIGTKLHELFEKADFQKDYSVAQLDAGSKKLLESFNKSTKNKEQDNTTMIALLLQNVLNAHVSFANTTFSLNQIPQNKRLNELEFLFPLHNENHIEQLKKLLLSYNTSIQSKYINISGMMTGFVDLLFEHEGKFYILDWKSNYLGFDISDYEGENLQAAMQHNQYTLQYLIYTVAVHKFLKQRLGEAYSYDEHFGGVIYIFLRGARANASSGIFTDRPSSDFVEALESALMNVS